MRSTRALILLVVLGSTACGGGEDGIPPSGSNPGGSNPGGSNPGGSNPAAPKFLAAVPGPELVRIDFPAASTKVPALLSPVYASVRDYVGALNADLTTAFDLLADGAAGPVEGEDATHQRRRAPLALDPAQELVLDVALVPPPAVQTFAVTLWIGPVGFEPKGRPPVIAGEAREDEASALEGFVLRVDLAALTTSFPQVDGTGVIQVAMQPFLGGPRELWYDFLGVSIGGAARTDRRSTYWVFADGSKALEFVEVAVHETVAYARWGDAGGRYDHHVRYPHATLGAVDEINTGCWDPAGLEAFFGWALLDPVGTYWGLRLGSEAEGCPYGPVADHPARGPEFDLLPAAGAWDALDLHDL